MESYRDDQLVKKEQNPSKNDLRFIASEPMPNCTRDPPSYEDDYTTRIVDGMGGASQAKVYTFHRPTGLYQHEDAEQNEVESKRRKTRDSNIEKELIPYAALPNYTPTGSTQSNTLINWESSQNYGAAAPTPNMPSVPTSAIDYLTSSNSLPYNQQVNNYNFSDNSRSYNPSQKQLCCDDYNNSYTQYLALNKDSAQSLNQQEPVMQYLKKESFPDSSSMNYASSISNRQIPQGPQKEVSVQLADKEERNQFEPTMQYLKQESFPDSSSMNYASSISNRQIPQGPQKEVSVQLADKEERNQFEPTMQYLKQESFPDSSSMNYASSISNRQIPQGPLKEVSVQSADKEERQRFLVFIHILLKTMKPKTNKEGHRGDSCNNKNTPLLVNTIEIIEKCIRNNRTNQLGYSPLKPVMEQQLRRIPGIDAYWNKAERYLNKYWCKRKEKQSLVDENQVGKVKKVNKDKYNGNGIVYLEPRQPDNDDDEHRSDESCDNIVGV